MNKNHDTDNMRCGVVFISILQSSFTMEHRSKLLISAGLLLVLMGASQAPGRTPPALTASPPSQASWTFRENFTDGIPGWISYPLAQDEGYDPSLYTATSNGSAVLVRDVVARGQKILRVGLLRPLPFRAAPASTFELNYRLEVGGRIICVRLTLAAANGHRYSAAIPASPGLHTVTINGQQLSVPAAGVAVQAIIVEAAVASPILGSRNRLTLRSFSIKAERPKTLALKAPQLEISPASGVAVANGVYSRLIPIELPGGERGNITIYDGSGRRSAGQVTSGSEPNKFKRPLVAITADSSPKPGLWSAHIQSGAAERDFRFLVLGKIPPHPRVLLTAGRLTQLRSLPGSSRLIEMVHHQAALVAASLAYNPNAGENIALLSPASVFPGLPQYFQMMEGYSRSIAFNALDFRLRGDHQSLENARTALLTISGWPTWTPPWFAAHGLHTYYEVGVFTQRVAFGYDLIADKLSAEDKARIADGLWRNSIQPTLEEYFFNDRLPTAASNHMANSVGGALVACAALAGDVPGWNSRFGPALAELIVAYENLLKGLFPGDGSEAEPAGYEDFAMEGMSWGAAALQALGIHPKGLNRMLDGFWWLRYAKFTPGKFLDTGDFDGVLSSLSGYAWPAENAHNPSLEDFYESAKGGTVTGIIHLTHTGRALEAAPTVLDLACCTRPATPVPNPPPDRIFPLRGSAVLRSGWNPGATVISLRVGPWFNHEHHDQGSFQVAAFGEKLIAEAGYADYYKDPRYANYFTQAPGHNTVVVDDDPFSQEDYDGRYWSALKRHASITEHLFSDGIDYLAANLAPAYRDGIKPKQYQRKYIFIKPDVLVIQDHLQFPAAHQCTFLLHAPPGARTRVHGASGTIQTTSAVASVTASDANLQWAIERAPIPENAYANLDKDNVLPRTTLQLDSNPAASVTFTVAMRFQKSSEAAAPLTTFQATSGAGFKTPDGGTVVLLRTAPGLLASPNTPFGEVSSDGDIAAITRRAGALDLLATAAGYLQRAHQRVFDVEPSSAKVNIALRQSRNGLAAHFECTKETTLRLLAARRPVSVALDHKEIPLSFSNGFVSIPRIPEGEHTVEIKYSSRL
ncbi:MAG TPA: heparinase II/III family protein [Terriglobia bacterium]|nr:heparinase II/III family protein [Terriglobia bacterium]